MTEGAPVRRIPPNGLKVTTLRRDLSLEASRSSSDAPARLAAESGPRRAALVAAHAIVMYRPGTNSNPASASSRVAGCPRASRSARTEVAWA